MLVQLPSRLHFAVMVMALQISMPRFPCYKCRNLAKQLRWEKSLFVNATCSVVSEQSKKKLLVTLETTDTLLRRSSEFEELLKLRQLDGYVSPDLPVVAALSDMSTP